MIEPTADEKRNGWTARRLELYRQEREKVHNLTPGNIITEFKRPKVRPPVLTADRSYNPHNW